MDEFDELIMKGLKLSERRMLEEKALHDDVVIQGLPDGTIVEVPARQLLQENFGVVI